MREEPSLNAKTYIIIIMQQVNEYFLVFSFPNQKVAVAFSRCSLCSCRILSNVFLENVVSHCRQRCSSRRPPRFQSSPACQQYTGPIYSPQHPHEQRASDSTGRQRQHWRYVRRRLSRATTATAAVSSSLQTTDDSPRRCTADPSPYSLRGGTTCRAPSLPHLAAPRI